MDMTLTLTQEQAKCLLDALCVYGNTTNRAIARCSAPDALPTERALIEHYQRENATAAKLRAALYRMAFGNDG